MFDLISIYITYQFISSCRGNETRTRIPIKVRTPNAVGNQLPVTPLFIGNILLFLYQLSYLPKLFDFVGRVRLELTTLCLSDKCTLNTCCVFPSIYILPYEYCAKIYKIFLISKFFRIFFLKTPFLLLWVLIHHLFLYFLQELPKVSYLFLVGIFSRLFYNIFFSPCWVSSW